MDERYPSRVVVEGLTESEVRGALGHVGLGGYTVESKYHEISNDPREISSIISPYQYLLRDHFDRFEEIVNRGPGDDFGRNTWSVVTHPQTYAKVRGNAPINLDPKQVGLTLKKRKKLGLPDPIESRSHDDPNAIQVGSFLNFVDAINEGATLDLIGLYSREVQFINDLAARLRSQIEEAGPRKIIPMPPGELS